MTSKLNVLTDQCRVAVCEVRPPQLAASLVDQFLSTTRAPCLSVIFTLLPDTLMIETNWAQALMCA